METTENAREITAAARHLSQRDGETDVRRAQWRMHVAEQALRDLAGDLSVWAEVDPAVLTTTEAARAQAAAVALGTGSLYVLLAFDEEVGLILDAKHYALSDLSAAPTCVERRALSHGAEWRRRAWSFALPADQVLRFETEQTAGRELHDGSERFARELARRLGWPVSDQPPREAPMT